MSIFGAKSPGLSVEDAMRDAIASSGMLTPEQRSRFMTLFTKYLLQRHVYAKSKIESLTPPPPQFMIKRPDIPPCPEDSSLRHELLDKLVVVKLNGGLGSTMGCHALPKSAIEVRNDMSFLDLTVRQIEYLNSLHGVDLPIILMNSFKTHPVTSKLIRKYRKHNLSVHTFLQNCYPRIGKDTLMPIPTGPFDEANAEEWYPPGHGDVYYSIWSSKILDSLLQEGKEYAFISNIDNLSASVDLDMLYHIYCEDIEMAMEVITPTRQDYEGGYLVGDGDKLRVIELVEVPAAQRDAFRLTHKHFNTNNIWINLKALKRIMESGDVDDQVIPQERTIGTDVGVRVLQLETTAGSAIRKFSKTLAIEVDRRMRYLPVKTTADLMLIQSDLFTVRHGTLILNSNRVDHPLPLIKLGQEFKAIHDYRRRVTSSPPNILELEHLTIAGDVYIGANVTLKGTVIIIAVDGSVIMIPDGSVLVDKVVTGNLRILDH